MSLSERFFHFFVSEDSPQRCFGDSGAGNWRSYQILLYIFEMTRASEGGFLSPPRWWIENQSCLCELCDTPHCIQMYRTWCFIRQIPFLIQKKSYVPPSSNQFVLFLLPIPCTSVYFRVLSCTFVYFRLLPCTLLKRFWFFYLPIFDIFTKICFLTLRTALFHFRVLMTLYSVVFDLFCRTRNKGTGYSIQNVRFQYQLIPPWTSSMGWTGGHLPPTFSTINFFFY